MLRLERVDVSLVWDLILPGVRRCIEEDPEKPRPEDIYHMLRASQATLLVGWEEGYAGFLLVSTHRTFWRQAPYLFVWHVYNEAGHDILQEGQVELERLAREAGYREIRFRASRLAFERLTKDLGYTLLSLEMRKEI